jgi:translation initiation factor IF-3
MYTYAPECPPEKLTPYSRYGKLRRNSRLQEIQITLCFHFLFSVNTKGVYEISKSSYRINGEIHNREVRLINENGENVGVVGIREALALAEQSGLDLVEIAPNAEPPVCKILDFGKFQYEQARKEREARKQQKQIEVKEIRLRPKTNEHHRSFKVRDARRWLEEGMKVKVRIRFRGREITYPEIARQLLEDVAKDLEDIAIIEVHPGMEGRTMLMVLAPGKQTES